MLLYKRYHISYEKAFNPISIYSIILQCDMEIFNGSGNFFSFTSEINKGKKVEKNPQQILLGSKLQSQRSHPIYGSVWSNKNG